MLFHPFAKGFANGKHFIFSRKFVPPLEKNELTMQELPP
jgi:hypothetical protein